MQQKVINPYVFIGAKHKEMLDFIGTNLPMEPTFDQLNTVLVAGSFNTDPDHPTISNFATQYAGIILPNVYNGYVNGWTADNGRQTTGNTETAAGFSVVSGQPSAISANTSYTEKQMIIIRHLLTGINTTLPAQMIAFLDATEETVVSSGLNYEEQIPLFIALTCARAGAEYWYNQMTTPGIWATYLDPTPAISYTYLPSFVSAAVQGALLSYGLLKKPEIQLLDVYVSLIGSTGLSAGVVVFGWMGK